MLSTRIMLSESEMTKFAPLITFFQRKKLHLFCFFGFPNASGAILVHEMPKMPQPHFPRRKWEIDRWPKSFVKSWFQDFITFPNSCVWKHVGYCWISTRTQIPFSWIFHWIFFLHHITLKCKKNHHVIISCPEQLNRWPCRLVGRYLWHH